MKRRIIYLLIAIASIVMLGLITLQVYWVKNTIELRNAEFSQNVRNALEAVSERLEKQEAIERMRENELSKDFISQLEEAKRLEEGLREMDTVVLKEGNEEKLLIAEKKIRIEPKYGEPYGVFETESKNATDIEELTTEDVFEESLVEEENNMERRSLFLSDMMQGLMSGSTFEAFIERVDKHLLDSLIRQELMDRGVKANYTYGVFGPKQSAVLVTMDKYNSDQSNILGSELKVRLFPNDLISDDHYLHLYFPGRKGYLLRAMGPMLSTSALFIIIMILVFVFAINIIYKQKRVSEIKNDLVNNLTHELKTPISTIALACEALNDPHVDKTPEQMKTFIGMIRDENKRLGVLVENVLQSAVVDSGDMKLKRVELDLHQLLNDVVKSMSMKASNKNGKIETDLQAEAPLVKADRIHMTNVFNNILDNALKYMRNEPHITVSTSSDLNGVTVKVADNGVGIDRIHQKKIFDKLYRVPTGNVHNVKGFGIGLSYVKAVVEIHHGSIKVSSQPGVGSTFSIYIPFDDGTETENAGGRR